jgi:hypothetical protein
MSSAELSDVEYYELGNITGEKFIQIKSCYRSWFSRRAFRFTAFSNCETPDTVSEKKDASAPL